MVFGKTNNALMVSSMSIKGFSKKTKIYRVTPIDHISSSGPAYLKTMKQNAGEYIGYI